MPDLNLTDDQKQYQDLARDFAGSEILPRAHQLDTTGAFPKDICRQAWEIGLMNGRIPEAFGGLGLGVFDATVIAEEIGAACSGIGAAIWGNDLAAAPVLVAGNQDQQKEFLEPLTAEFTLAGYAFPSSSQVTYKRTGDTYELNGKAIVLNAENAKWIFVAASNDESLSTFIVPSAGGVNVGEPVARVGLKAADLRTVELHAVKVPIKNLLGKEGAGKAVIENVHAVSYPVLGAYAVGIMRSALENSVRYSKERHTMGVPIANHQAVAFMLADMAKDIEAARYMLRKAAWLADNAQSDLNESIKGKNFACEAAMRATTDAVQVYGGYGYSKEYPVEKLMRDAKMLQVLEHTPVSDRIAIARALLAAV